MERQGISPAVYDMLQKSQPISASVEKKFFHFEKTVGQLQKFDG